MSHIFISYSHKDKDYVRKLRDALVKRGFTVWIDDRIDYGSEWPMVIQERLDECSAFLLVATENSYKSKWVRMEVARARRIDKPFFPLLLSGQPWLTIESTQYVDVTDGSLPPESFYEQLGLPEHDPNDEKIEALKSQATRYELMGDLSSALNVWYEIKRLDAYYPRVDRKIDELEGELRRIKEDAAKQVKSKREKLERPGAGTLLESIIQKLTVIRSNSLRGWSFLKITGMFAFIAVAVWGSILLIPYLQSLIPSPTPGPTSTSAAISTSAPTPAKTDITDEKDVQMVLVPAGEFVMGSVSGLTNERPAHAVNLDAFYIDKYEVTNALYRICDLEMGGGCLTPYHTSLYRPATRDNYPVVAVTWDMAKTYCEWRGARLPTEAEWEKAARGTDERPYPWGSQEPIVQYVNYKGTDSKDIGSYPFVKSPYGAFDLAGNVSEWVSDWYSPDYYQTLSLENISNPIGPLDSAYPSSHNFYGRVVRGGSWLSKENYQLSTTYRDHAKPDSYADDLGFRCAKDAP